GSASGSSGAPGLGLPAVPERANLPAKPGQGFDIVERLKDMADLLGDALAAGERRVHEAQNEAAALVVAAQSEKESAQRDAAAAWGEAQRARAAAEQAERNAERKLAEAQSEAAQQVAAAQKDRDAAQRDAAAAWGEAQRAR